MGKYKILIGLLIKDMIKIMMGGKKNWLRRAWL
jgi:hypothetical protein